MSKKKNPHAGHRTRLLQQVEANGLDSLQDHQLLEFVLQGFIPYKDTNVIAHDLIDKCGSLAMVFETEKSKLMEVNGVGNSVAGHIATYLDVYEYLAKYETDNNPKCIPLSFPIPFSLPSSPFGNNRPYS